MSRLLDSKATRVVAVLVALAAMATILTELFLRPAKKTAVLFFPVAVHLYAGSEVDVLGVKIGTVSSVKPVGTQVRVVISYDASRKIPANAAAPTTTPPAQSPGQTPPPSLTSPPSSPTGSWS